jgi:hypothetical protein
MAKMGSTNPYIRGRLVYDGKSWVEWMDLIQTERSPQRLTEAVAAMAALAPESGSEDVAMAMLHVMRAYGSRSFSTDSPQGRLIDQTYQTLLRMDPAIVISAICSEIYQGNDNSREFLILLVSTISQQAGRMRTALVEQAPTSMVPQLLEMSRSEDATLRRWSLELAGILAMACQTSEGGQIDGLLPRFEEALKSNDDDVALLAATTLCRLAPKTEGLADVLVRLLAEPARREVVIGAIQELGPASTAVVPGLAKLLAQEAAKPAATRPPGLLGGGSFGMGSGMGGMGGFGTDDLAWRILSMLGRLGPSAKDALPVLREIAGKEGPYQQTVQQLIDAIEQAEPPK